VVAGLAVVPDVLAVFGGDIAFQRGAADGAACGTGDLLGTLSGELRAILAVERTLLNLLGRAGGVATLTRRYVEAVAGTRAAIFDTRKTMPGLRALDKYAVGCGGGRMHRVGLYDAVLIKDNHLAHVALADLPRRIAAAARAARAQRDLRFVEVEVDTLEQLGALLELPEGTIDIVLLDNMMVSQLVEAVSLRDRRQPRLRLEASGGISLSTVRAVAETGVERISVGALTHSAAALELGLDIEAR
jgi:nicotinate-nucleotide pyrophosphorylase (carboxylating)